MLYSALLLCGVAAVSTPQDPPAPPDHPTGLVAVDRDNFGIAESCTLEIAATPLVDLDGNGVIHLVGNDIVVDLADARLHGALDGTQPDKCTGIGIHITGRNVTLRNARISGFKVAIHAENAPGLTVENCDLSGNYRQQLKSSPRAEDSSDWLWPHDNDENQWMERYGAALYVENSKGVTIRNVRVREGQNGIILDRVTDSLVYDNDCSFLSGWGLALWRSSRNTITRNALDFCVRGYSHEVYNRGQDSAGLLMFEQCHDNLVAENSITHGGDGVFAFAGKEALGETPPLGATNGGDVDPEWYLNRGHTGNTFVANDCSDAVAHGIELTFSFDNRIVGNRIAGNAICGIWGGYSQRTLIAGNTFDSNGGMPYGLERGGINIEHGRGNRILANTFTDNACGIHLWWDPDEHLTSLPWAEANGASCDNNVIYRNSFTGDAIAVQLRQTGATDIWRNTYESIAQQLEADQTSAERVKRPGDHAFPPLWSAPTYEALGTSLPIGARQHLAGRENIIMTEWGPWDHESPLLRAVSAGPGDHMHTYELHQASRLRTVEFIEPSMDDENASLGGVHASRSAPDRQTIVISAPTGVDVYPYHLRLITDDFEPEVRGTIIIANWRVTVFPWTVDPREDVAAWRAEADGDAAISVEAESLDLVYGHGGPSDVALSPEATAAGLPGDQFGTIAATELTFPPGRWRLRTLSDDGIRVWLGDDVVIDDWTWHGPTEHVHEFELTESKTLPLRIEHFELDGYAVLTLSIETMD